jgi:hypothetical protein
VAFWTGDLLFICYLYETINFHKKYAIFLTNRLNIICLIPMRIRFCTSCGFNFVQVWRVFFAQYKAQRSNQRNMSGRFPHGMVISFERWFVLSVYELYKFSEKTSFSRANRLHTICLIPMRIRFCTRLDGLLCKI